MRRAVLLAAILMGCLPLSTSTPTGSSDDRALTFVVQNDYADSLFWLSVSSDGGASWTKVLVNERIGSFDIATREDVVKAVKGDKLLIQMQSMSLGETFNFNIDVDVQETDGALRIVYDFDPATAGFRIVYGWLSNDNRVGGGGDCASDRGYCLNDDNCCGGSCGISERCL